MLKDNVTLFKFCFLELLSCLNWCYKICFMNMLTWNEMENVPDFTWNLIGLSSHEVGHVRIWS